MERPKVPDTEASSQQPHKWRWKADTPVPLRPSDEATAGLQLRERPNDELIHSWIPDPQILHILVTGYCFKLLDLGVICYTAIDIQYNNWDIPTGKLLSHLRYNNFDELLDN